MEAFGAVFAPKLASPKMESISSHLVNKDAFGTGPRVKLAFAEEGICSDTHKKGAFGTRQGLAHILERLSMFLPKSKALRYHAVVVSVKPLRGYDLTSLAWCVGVELNKYYAVKHDLYIEDIETGEKVFVGNNFRYDLSHSVVKGSQEELLKAPRVRMNVLCLCREHSALVYIKPEEMEVGVNRLNSPMRRPP